MRPLTIPYLSFNTFANGARQFVVHDAFEITLWSFGSYFSSFTPMTIVMSSPSAGAEIITFLAPPLVMWFSAPFTSLPFLFMPSFLIVKRPVDSTTIWTPRSFQGSSEGSLFARTFMILPSTEIVSSDTAFTSPGNLPWTESYFKRYALVFASVMSFTATNSRSLPFFSSMALATRRPILPKPLIPILTAISTSSHFYFLFLLIYNDTSLSAQAAISGGVWLR